jgi:two-component system, sensor histidine kinase LadS
MIWIMSGFSLVWGALFTFAFLEISANISWMKKIFYGVIAVSVVTVLCGFFRLHTAGFAFSHLGGILLPVACTISAVIRLRQGYKPARYYLLAWIFLLTSGVIFILMGIQVLAVSFFTANSVLIGMALESILLSLALASRIRELMLKKEYYKKGRQRYQELSITDALTGLFNKRYMVSKLASEADHAFRMDQPLSVIMMDLDDFKKVNDTYGHSAGDDILRALGLTIRDFIRKTDTACRYGGEEFVLIMPGTDMEKALMVAERIRRAMSEKSYRPEGNQPLSVTISLGLARLRPDETVYSLMDRADKGLYRAKNEGKNRTVVMD